MNEIWKEIDGYNGLYWVSNMGRIKSTNNKDYILKCPLDMRGYPRVAISYNRAKRTFKVHRLVAKAFILNPDNKRTVNHKNGVKTDNRVDNLEWATNRENIKHSFAKLGRKPPKCPPEFRNRGDKHPLSKPVVQMDMVTGSIIKVHQSQKAAGADLKISSSNIARAIKNNHCDGGYRWQHLKS